MFADLSIHEAVRDELEDLDLTRRRILTELARDLRREGNDRAVATRAAPRRGSFEPAAVVPVPVEYLLALGSVHESGIGAARVPL